jgi:putative chitinase
MDWKKILAAASGAISRAPAPKIDVKRVQRRLVEAKRDPGPIDGIMGRKTWRALLDHMARRPLDARGDLIAEGMIKHLPAYSIDTELRIAHFLAQACHETGDFNHLREIWGPTAAQRRYEGRKDLGNTQPGDGRRYMGRGIFQLTGRANYREIGKALSLPLEAEPDLAARGDLSVRIACHYWMTRGINALADKDDIQAVTKKINGGHNGLKDRERCLARAKAILC